MRNHKEHSADFSLQLSVSVTKKLKWLSVVIAVLFPGQASAPALDGVRCGQNLAQIPNCGQSHYERPCPALRRTSPVAKPVLPRCGRPHVNHSCRCQVKGGIPRPR